jgi:NADH-quinone oxidoreductase subunit J
MMNTLFYIAAAVAVICTFRVITHVNAVHALLYMIVSLLAAALIFFLLGAPFAAALEVIIYAGAIMVLFVFVVMMLNLGFSSGAGRRPWMRPGVWLGPGVLALILLIELVCILSTDSAAGHAVGLATGHAAVPAAVGPYLLGRALFGPYVLGVELISILLMAGLVGAYHLARPDRPGPNAPADSQGGGS